MTGADARVGGPDPEAPIGRGDEGSLALWCTPVSEVGGVARHFLDVARAGIPGWRIAFLVPPGPLADHLQQLGVAVTVAPVGASDGASASVPAMRRVLRALGPDLLHTHLAFADISGALAVRGLRSARGRRIRLVSTEHGIAGPTGMYQRSPLRTQLMLGIHRARLHATDALIAVSDSTREQVRRQWGGGAPVTVIRNVVDAPPVRPEPTPGLRLLSLARLAPEKRIDAVLRAVALVRARHPEATLTIAGEGPQESRLRALAGDLDLTGAVTFTGHVDAGEELRAHDVVIQLSAWENLSYTLLDAVVSGTGVVATDVGGNREIVPQRCLVDPEEPRTVAAAIIAQGRDLEARPRSLESPQTVRDMAGALARVYEEVLVG
ncbi:glycosyltransferase family 4 protein [Brachybacterium muris]|uniref:Glycosyl transferase n=1 Tax=Brachybacterium muris UCD-AY4 TaxID=1249481 RepID=A0A022KSU9_9MICO|nr:glycosyltransferase family 4 protein [Brachybacterium muris]EYT48754.1 glycosyl transferase [Brachybacterium muris UCD-AY4]